MAKDPAFLFYPGDFMQGTQTFTREEKGAYLDLLILQFNEGHLPIDMVRRCLNGDFERLWPFLQKKFSQDPDGNFFNERLDQEKFKRAEYTASRRRNLTKTNDMELHMSEHMPLHMENENKNENKDVNVIDRKGGMGENVPTKQQVYDIVFAEPRFLKTLQDSHPGKDYKLAFDQCYAYHITRPNPPNMAWVWRQKLLTWLSNMSIVTNKKTSKPKMKLKDIEP